MHWFSCKLIWGSFLLSCDKGAFFGQKEPEWRGKGVDLRESSRGAEVCVSRPAAIDLSDIFIIRVPGQFFKDLHYTAHEAGIAEVDQPSQPNGRVFGKA